MSFYFTGAGGVRPAVDYVRGQDEGQGGAPERLPFIGRSACFGGSDATVVTRMGGLIIESDEDVSSQVDEGAASPAKSGRHDKGKAPEDEGASSSSTAARPGKAESTPSTALVRAWTGKDPVPTAAQRVLSSHDSPATQALEAACRQFEDDLRIAFPPGSAPHAGAAFVVGFVAFAPYALRVAMLNALDPDAMVMDPLGKAACGAAVAGVLDVVANRTYLPLIMPGGSSSPHMEALDKQWAVAMNKCRDLVSGAPNDSEFPLSARQYFSTQARVFFTEHLPFYTFMVSNACLTLASLPDDDQAWKSNGVGIGVGFVMSGLSVMLLQLSRATYPDQFFKPTPTGDYAQATAEHLASRRQDLVAARATAGPDEKIEIDKALKKTEKMLAQAEASISKMGFMGQGLKSLVGTRHGWGEMLGRSLCLMPVAIMSFVAGNLTDDDTAIPVGVGIAIGQIAFGSRNEIAAACEMVLSLPQGVWRAAQRCVETPEAPGPGSQGVKVEELPSDAAGEDGGSGIGSLSEIESGDSSSSGDILRNDE